MILSASASNPSLDAGFLVPNLVIHSLKLKIYFFYKERRRGRQFSFQLMNM
jgi:hypothetical protein